MARPRMAVVVRCVLIAVSIGFVEQRLNESRWTYAGDRILLRKLDVIQDRTVVSFDEDGVVLDDGRLLTWDEIEKATVAKDQAKFDQLLNELGSPLYRIRQRMTVGDYAGLTAPAEAMFTRYETRRGASAYLVFQALIWARLDAGRREEAVEPYLLATECLRVAESQGRTLELPDKRPVRRDPTTFLCEDLPPVWFDPEAARRVLPRVGRAVGAMRTPWPVGVRLYYASLAAVAGEAERMQAALAEVTEPQHEPWRRIVLSQYEIVTKSSDEHLRFLEKECLGWKGMTQAAALVCAGRAAVASPQVERRREGMLMLLRVPAVHGKAFPDLSSAALYFTMQSLTADGAVSESVSVRNEILEKYPQSLFARRIQQETEKKP